MPPLYKPLAAATLLFTLTTAAQTATPVQDIKDLKSLQTKTSGVVKKVLPATVSLFSAKNGASGSGVIVSRDGLILTAGHVVRGTETMTVIFPDGTQARGKVLGANFTRDSAMIQLIGDNNGKGWPHAEIGHSKHLQTGDLVIALGHAGGYDPIRTPPVRFGRLVTRSANKFITSDCTLIGGDSGGPLFDIEGRLIGIHSSIGASLSSNNHASIEGFHQDWEKLKKGETWGRLGGSALDNPDAPVIGILTETSRRGGIGIRHAFKGGPAHKAGLRTGDIIRSINHHQISNLRALHSALAHFKPGDSVKIHITRGTDSLIRNVTLGRRGTIFH